MAHRKLLTYALLASLGPIATAAPISESDSSCISDPSCGPIPGESNLYNTYTGIEAPWPTNITGAILNTTTGPPAPDDLLFQNLLSAEWIIFSFYQQGVEFFNESAFIAAGYENNTYERIREIRNNEAGHIRIFQDQISSNSIKPGPCQYKYPFTDATSYLALQTIIEVSSMVFLTGLELQAQTDLSKSALVAIAATESRHNTWSLINNWHASPFAGPADTVFPYANQILAWTNNWVTPNSCPSQNPPYPTPDQNLPTFSLDPNTTTSIAPGTEVNFVFDDPAHIPAFANGTDYYAVFFHGVLNISMPFDAVNYSTTIPGELEALGVYEVVIADVEGAPTMESVLAGPEVIYEAPEWIGLAAVR